MQWRLAVGGLRLTFSPWLDTTGLISKGSVFWLSDQVVAGERIVGYPFLATQQLPGNLERGTVYLEYETECDGGM